MSNERQAHAPSESAGCLVAVVDDDADLRCILHEVLTEEGWSVLALEDGEAALAHLRVVRPTVLMLDQRMPGLCGTELFDHLRPLGWEAPRTILVTAAADGAQLAAERGIGFLKKPFSIEDLTRRVRDACDDRH